MRQWINEKKKNLIEKIKKDVESDYKKKKQEAPAAVEPAKTEDKPVVEEEKKAEESAIKTEEIELIDTTTKPEQPAK